MSFIDFLKKMDKAIDNALDKANEATDNFERKYVRPGKEPLDVDKELDKLVDKGIEKAKPYVGKAKDKIVDLSGKAKDKACDLAGKAKEQVVATKDKVMHKADAATADTIAIKAEEVAEILEAIDIPIVVDDSKVVPMAKIIDCSHKTPNMDLKANMPKANPVPTFYKMQVFVDNSKDNTVFAEVR